MGPVSLLSLSNSCGCIRGRIFSNNCSTFVPGVEEEDMVFYTDGRRGHMYVMALTPAHRLGAIYHTDSLIS